MGGEVQHVSLVPTNHLLVLYSLWADMFVRDEVSQKQLIDLCKAVGKHISSLVQAVRSSVTNHSNPAAQLELINESLAMIPVSLLHVYFHFHMYQRLLVSLVTISRLEKWWWEPRMLCLMLKTS